jgi:hypothetical protein
MSLPPPTIETLAVELHGLIKLLDERYEVYKSEQARLATEVQQSNARQNEWRQALLDQGNKFVTASYFDAKVDGIVQQLDALRQLSSSRSGKETGALNTWMVGLVVVGLAVNIAVHFLK